jgi:hypothetical protein
MLRWGRHGLKICTPSTLQLQSWTEPLVHGSVANNLPNHTRFRALLSAQVSGVGIIVATRFKQLQPTPDGIHGTFSFVATSLAIAFFEANNALAAYIEERVIIGKETFQKVYR